MGNAARLGLKPLLRYLLPLIRSRRNGECSPTGIETIAITGLLANHAIVKMGNAARLGLKQPR